MRILSLAAIPRKFLLAVIITVLMTAASACAILRNLPGISAEQNSRIPPFPPSPLTAKKVEAGVKLDWNGTKSDYVKGYRIYRRPEGQKRWEFIHEEKVRETNEGPFSYTDSIKNWSGKLQYGITAVDTFGNESTEKELSNLLSP